MYNFEQVSKTVEDLSNMVNKFDLIDIHSFTINPVPNKHRINVFKFTWNIIKT